MAQSQFAKKLLSKYGWSEGKGLGKNEDGIKNPILARFTPRKQGLGYDPHNLSSTWWHDLYNDTAKRISVKTVENTIKLHTKMKIEVTSASPYVINKTFVKAGASDNSKGLTSQNRDKTFLDQAFSDLSSDSSSNDESLGSSEGRKRKRRVTLLKLERIRKQDEEYRKSKNLKHQTMEAERLEDPKDTPLRKHRNKVPKSKIN